MRMINRRSAAILTTLASLLLVCLPGPAQASQGFSGSVRSETDGKQVRGVMDGTLSFPKSGKSFRIDRLAVEDLRADNVRISVYFLIEVGKGPNPTLIESRKFADLKGTADGPRTFGGIVITKPRLIDEVQPIICAGTASDYDAHGCTSGPRLYNPNA